MTLSDLFNSKSTILRTQREFLRFEIPDPLLRGIMHVNFKYFLFILLKLKRHKLKGTIIEAFPMRHSSIKLAYETIIRSVT